MDRRYVTALERVLPEELGAEAAPIVVVDDGSTDGTREAALAAGALIEQHPENLGKGVALVTGFRALARAGADAVTDALRE